MCASTGVCGSSPKACTESATCDGGQVTCGDGECVKSADDCSVILPACEGGQLRCADGRCDIPSESCIKAEACTDGKALCADGICRDSEDQCPPAYGCFGNLPFTCPDGTCSSTVCGGPPQTLSQDSMWATPVPRVDATVSLLSGADFNLLSNRFGLAAQVTVSSGLLNVEKYSTAFTLSVHPVTMTRLHLSNVTCITQDFNRTDQLDSNTHTGNYSTVLRSSQQVVVSPILNVRVPDIAEGSTVLSNNITLTLQAYFHSAGTTSRLQSTLLTAGTQNLVNVTDYCLAYVDPNENTWICAYGDTDESSRVPLNVLQPQTLSTPALVSAPTRFTGIHAVVFKPSTPRMVSPQRVSVCVSDFFHNWMEESGVDMSFSIAGTTFCPMWTALALVLMLLCCFLMCLQYRIVKRRKKARDQLRLERLMLDHAGKVEDVDRLDSDVHIIENPLMIRAQQRIHRKEDQIAEIQRTKSQEAAEDALMQANLLAQINALDNDLCLDGDAEEDESMLVSSPKSGRQSQKKRSSSFFRFFS